MRTWNYRLVKTLTSGDHEYTFREVYYNDAGDVLYWSAGPCYPAGETLDEVAHDVQHMQEALTLPVLTATDLPGGNT